MDLPPPTLLSRTQRSIDALQALAWFLKERGAEADRKPLTRTIRLLKATKASADELLSLIPGGPGDGGSNPGGGVNGSGGTSSGKGGGGSDGGRD